MAGKLRAVTPDEKPARRDPKNISDALDGSSRDVLAAMRKALAKQLDTGQIAGNAIASAYRELRELDRLIRQADVEHDEVVEVAPVGNAFDASAV